MQKYVVKHTVPVFVFVENGKVAKVVTDDEALSEPVAIVEDTEQGWWNEDERPLTEEETEQYDKDSAGTWPAWDRGFA